MPLPIAVARAYDYTDWQAANPLAPLPATRIETDFDNLCSYTLQLTDYLSNATVGGELPVTGGTMLGPLFLNANPTLPLHAANKAYVDAFILTAGLPTTGGTLSGFLTLHAAPTAALHAATKGYVDSVVLAGGLPTTGGTLTGNLGITAANAALTLNKAASAQFSRVVGQMAGSLRWTLDLGNNTAEAGANAGSNFSLSRYSDAGALIDTPLQVNRATGAATFSANISATALRGGANDAGTLRMWGRADTVAFNYDPAFAQLLFRINDVVQQRLIHSNSYYNLEYYAWGAANSILFAGLDGSQPVVLIDAFSDARLKTNIRASTADALAGVLSLEVSDFDWNADGMRNQNVTEPAYASVTLGLIAQNVEAVFPGAVADFPAILATGERADRKKINNGVLVPALIRAIQQLEARVRFLETHT